MNGTARHLRRRLFAAFGVVAIVAALVLGNAAAAGADPDAPAGGGAAALTLVGQDRVTTPAGSPVTFTVRLPAGVDPAVLADPTTEIQLTSFAALERSQPANALPLDNRARLQRVMDGTLPAELHDIHVPTATLARAVADEIAVTVVVDGDGTTGTALGVEGPGLHPVRLVLRSNDRVLGEVVTFVHEPDPTATATPLAVAVAVGTDAAVHLDDSGGVVLDAATLADLTKLVTILETSAMPVTVHVAPALLAALRGTEPALADRLAAALGNATILAAPRLPLDPSAAAAADQGPLYTQWLAAGEDMFGGADLPGTTLRAATAVTTPLSEPGGELLRDLGTRLLLLPTSIYDGLDGSIGGFNDGTQLVRVRLADDRSLDAAVVDRFIGPRLATPSTTNFLDAVYDTVDLLAARQDIVDRGLSPARRSVLIGTDRLGLPDPATLGPLTSLIATTPLLTASSVDQLGANTDTMLYDGGPSTVDLPATTEASIADRIAVRTDLAARGSQVQSMLLPENTLPAQWQAKLDLLPSPAITDAQVALIANDLSAQYAQIRAAVEPPQDLDFTMTGRTSTLRVKLRNNADFPVRVVVRLGAASNKLTFPAEAPQVLKANDTTELKFEIKARANGRFPVYIALLAPSDTGPNPNELARTRFTATVFALSGLGNLVTGAALLVLLTWWVHHIRTSRRRKAAERARLRHPATTDEPGSDDPAATPVEATASSVPDP